MEVAGSLEEFTRDFAALGSVARLTIVVALLEGPLRRQDAVAMTGLDDALFAASAAELSRGGLVVMDGDSILLEREFASRCRSCVEVALRPLRRLGEVCDAGSP